MMKKIVKYSGITFAILSLLTLSLPVFSTRITDGEACDLVVNGYNLVEFSPWGGIVLLAPLLLLGLMLSKLRNTTKTIGLIVLFALNGVALCASTSAAYKWMCDVSTGFVEPYMYHVIYALLLFVAMICFFVWCNYSLNIKSLKDFFVGEERIEIEPIDHRNEKFFWCNKPYNFAKYKETGDVTMGESTLCFATSEGYFAGLNDGDAETYFNIEVLEDDGAVAFVMGTMPTGIYGMFYEGQEFLKDLDMTVDICPFDEIEKDEAKLRIPDKNEGFSCDDVFVTPYAPDNIRVSSIDGLEDLPAIGAAVMQGEKLIAFVTEYDTEKHEYKCVAAEMIAIDLCRKIYEHRVYQAMKQRELGKLTVKP